MSTNTKNDAARAATPTASEPTLTAKQIGDPIMAHDTSHPVDSAIHTCCGGIGAHTRECREDRYHHGYHTTWCTSYDDESTLHSKEEPYCSTLLNSTPLIPEGDVVKTQVWASPTRAFTHGTFTPAEHGTREERYNGVELVVETWRGPQKGWDKTQKLRLTSHAARTLATILIRAADIEQGLTR